MTLAFERLSLLGDLSKSDDQETLGIAGSIFKRRWEQDGSRVALECAFAYYFRGYQVGNTESATYDNGYTAINAAFILDLLDFEEQRAAKEVGTTVDSSRPRRLQADKIRREILDSLPKLAERADRAKLRTDSWFLVTLGEAALGLGDLKEASRWLNQAAALPNVPDWEFEATARQLARLAQLRSENENPNEETRAVLRGFFKGDADAVVNANAEKSDWRFPAGASGPRCFTLVFLPGLPKLTCFAKSKCFRASRAVPSSARTIISN